VVVGPNMENFADITREFLDAGALLQVATTGDLSRIVDQLLGDGVMRLAYGEKARGLVEKQCGCIGSMVDAALVKCPQGEMKGGRYSHG